jgi:YD repeat-containing protein
MKRFTLSFILILLVLGADAQYYYNDIVANLQSNNQYQLIKKNRIKKVTAVSYESDNELNQAFKIEQSVNTDASKIATTSVYEGSGNSFSTGYYANNRIERNEDSSNRVFTTTQYSYNSAGNVTSITTTTRDAFMGSSSKEDHQWFYNEKNQPAYMFKIKDGVDTTRVDLIYDEKGNVGEEVWKRKGRVTEHYYYYWNDNHQLTDIVRFNNKVRKMLPDFLFEYDAEGRVSQMTQVPANSSNYMIWKYVYDEKGLKKRELVVNKQRQPVGRVEYQYQ